MLNRESIPVISRDQYTVSRDQDTMSRNQHNGSHDNKVTRAPGLLTVPIPSTQPVHSQSTTFKCSLYQYQPNPSRSGEVQNCLDIGRLTHDLHTK